MFKKTILLVIGLLCLGSMISPAVAKDGAKPAYRFAVFPYLPPREIEKIYSQVAKDLSLVLDHPVEFKTSTSYGSFMEAMINEKYEFAFVQPFDYVELADNHSYLPLATRENLLRAVVVVPNESDIKDWADLKGKQLALTPESAAVSYLIKHELKRFGLKIGKDIKVRHYRSHFSCMQQLKIKKADACGTARPAVKFFENKMKVKLRVIAQTDPVPNSLFVAHSSVPKGIVNRVQKRILEWSVTDSGKQLMKQVRLSKFREIDNQAYDLVRDFKQ